MGLQFTVEDAVVEEIIPEDTILRARLTEIKPRTVNWNDRHTGEPKSVDKLDWFWEVTQDGQWRGRRVKGTCDAQISVHPRNKFRMWAEAILQRELPMAMNIDTDDLVGLTADISIAHRPDKKDPARVFVEIDEVMPATGSFSDEPPF